MASKNTMLCNYHAAIDCADALLEDYIDEHGENGAQRIADDKDLASYRRLCAKRLQKANQTNSLADYKAAEEMAAMFHYWVLEHY